jgi:hypothetical protein
LTKQQKEAMKASGEAIPEEQKPVTVQVLIKWRQKYKGKWRSFETRSGVRRLYGDNVRGDKFIYKAALEQEGKYQNYLNGQRPPELRSVTPFIPGNQNTPPPPPPPRLPSPPSSPTPPPPLSSPPIVPSGENTKKAKKAAMEEFKEDYLFAAGVDEWSELTTRQQSDRIEAFKLFWAKKLSEVAG